MSSGPGIRHSSPFPPLAIWEPLGWRRREGEPRTGQVFSGWKLYPGAEGAPPAGHLHGYQPDLRAGPLPLGSDQRSAGLGAQASLSWGTIPPASIPGLGRTQDLPPTPYRLAGCPDLPGRTEGARRDAGSGCKPSGTLAGVKTEGGLTSAAHVPSGTGRPGCELHSAGRTKTRTHSLGPPRGGHSPGGKLQWPLGRGPGARGPVWGAGGSGESGAFFVCKVSLNNGCSALPSPPPPPRLCPPPPPLAASASEQPARPPQATRPLGWGTRQGRARHSHSLTLSLAHARTHAAPAGSRPFLPFSPSLPARFQSLSQNEAPGRAEGGAAPTGSAPAL